jgi:catechol 2,3-dioxygenase-like lactoylglutathione lyase family enzyme
MRVCGVGGLISSSMGSAGRTRADAFRIISSLTRGVGGWDVFRLVVDLTRFLHDENFTKEWGMTAVSADLSISHVHLIVPDVDANKKFWVAIGGAPITLGAGTANPIEGVQFGGFRVLLRKGNPSGPASGSTVNHFGFSVPNVGAAMGKWKGAGLKIEAGRNAQQGYVWTPGELVRVEVLGMPGQMVPIAFHHVHFFLVANSAGGIPEVQAWYAKLFGALPGKRGRFDTMNVHGGELTLTLSDMPIVPSKGRAVDHYGFWVKDMEAYCKKLEVAGLTLDVPYTERSEYALSLAFLTDPWGTSVELNEELPHSRGASRYPS